MKTKITTTALDDVLRDSGIAVVSVGREITAHCPFHTDKHPSFSMNASNGKWICFQCGERGTLEYLLKRLSGERAGSFESLLREVRWEKLQSVKDLEPEPISSYALQAKLSLFGPPPQWALKERGISAEIAEGFDVHWNTGWVIPVNSPEGALWGWQFKRMKFVSNYPTGIKKSRTLFGLGSEWLGFPVDFPYLVLVESPLDVLHLASCGVCAVASFGAFVSREQIRLLIEITDRVVLALDNDEEGKRQTKKIYPVLARAIPTSVAEFWEKDPGEMTKRRIQEVFG